MFLVFDTKTTKLLYETEANSFILLQQICFNCFIDNNLLKSVITSKTLTASKLKTAAKKLEQFGIIKIIRSKGKNNIAILLESSNIIVNYVKIVESFSNSAVPFLKEKKSPVKKFIHNPILTDTIKYSKTIGNRAKHIDDFLNQRIMRIM